MDNEFGTGLRAHLRRRGEPQTSPSTPLEVEPARRTRLDLDARLDALSAAEAELNWREQRVNERELAFHVAVQRTVYVLATEMLEGGLPALPQDELARARARKRGFAA
jgi:hypothetical protein